MTCRSIKSGMPFGMAAVQHLRTKSLTGGLQGEVTKIVCRFAICWSRGRRLWDVAGDWLDGEPVAVPIIKPSDAGTAARCLWSPAAEK